MAAMTAAFLFLQLFFTPYVMTHRSTEGIRALDLRCPVCSREFALDTPSPDELMAMADSMPGIFIPQPVYQCPDCRFTAPEEAFDREWDNEYTAEFVEAVKSYVASDEYKALAAEAPSYFLFARLIENAFADSPARKLLYKDIFPGADRYVAGLFYAMASFQAEGSDWFGEKYAANSDYATLGLEESARCLEGVRGSREFREAPLTAAYVRADALRRLGRFDEAKKLIDLFRGGFTMGIENRDVWSRHSGLAEALEKLSDRQERLNEQGDDKARVVLSEYVEDYSFIVFQ